MVIIENNKYKSVYGIIVHIKGESLYLDCSVWFDPVPLKTDQYVEQVMEFVRSNVLDNRCIDCHTQDQLLIYMALARGSSRLRVGSEITDHTKSCFEIINTLIPDAKIKVIKEGEDDDVSQIIEIEGIGHKRQVPAV
eukprot:TRINITY_DN6624_c0_g1_i7.p2 TRINITY_DN6624_c0_g1~~TRINITY_DN6624_c0_g1_i7.p2  ORF type:complete len:137 (+),score=15.36 TRINITY_DN6624_c0_g1_i7:294-704(+)